jgi:hypothetical protein
MVICPAVSWWRRPASELGKDSDIVVFVYQNAAVGG